MEKRDKVKIAIWVIVTAVVATVCGLLIWFAAWLGYGSRREYDWGENLNVGVYTTDDQAVTDFFGERVYIEIEAKNSGDCSGEELLNYLPQSRVFKLYSESDGLFDTRVTYEVLFGPDYFDIVVYKKDGQMLAFRISTVYSSDGELIKNAIDFDSDYPSGATARFTRRA